VRTFFYFPFTIWISLDCQILFAKFDNYLEMNNSPISPSVSRSPDLVDVQYLNELMTDRSVLERLPKRFMHLERLLDQG
jgi:hypothetical protein